MLDTKAIEEAEQLMRMTIRYQNGVRAEAVLLAAGRDRMRVAVDSQGDTIELQKADTAWRTEDGTEVSIEAMIPLAGLDVAQFCSAVCPRTLAAGQAAGCA